MALRLGQGYSIALKHYTQQKEEFLNYLQIGLNEEEIKAIDELGINISTKESNEAIDQLINEIQTIINTNGDILAIRQEIAQAYKNKEIDKETANKMIEQKMSSMFDPLWFQSQVLSKLGSTGNQTISKIDDNALLGRIKMLFNIAMRHMGPLNPSDFTRSQIEGILYEHAVIDGMQKYFSKISDLSDIIEITAEGAKGGRSDIKFSFSPEKFNKNEIGEIKQRDFNIQVKNVSLEDFLSSQDHSEKLRVGGGKEIFKNELLVENKNPSIEYTMYFLSRNRNVIRAIGEDITLYGYAHGKLKFTADLIKTLHYEKHYNLAMPKIQSKQKSAYIEWMRQKKF